jgi:hypothetical protein
MIKQIHSIARVAGLLPFGIVLLLGMQTAQAKQCSAAIPPNPQGHWSYRFIDGRKCWYQGENNLSKSLLQWPEQTSALSPSSQTESLPDEELMPSVKETVSASSEKHNNQSKPDSDSFDARWRGLETTRVNN